MASVDPAVDLNSRVSNDTKNEVEVAPMDEKVTAYRLSEAEIPLEQRKEEARVLFAPLHTKINVSLTNL